jgi:hypothetical protein
MSMHQQRSCPACMPQTNFLPQRGHAEASAFGAGVVGVVIGNESGSEDFDAPP